MYKTTTYKVTNDHIKKGNALCEHSCPIALCLKENFYEDGYENLYVSADYIYSEEPLNEHAIDTNLDSYLMSSAIQEWIERFDRGCEVPEITLVLDEHKFYLEGEE